jgi:EmrB/QacA subfamily drug resistance transporter
MATTAVPTSAPTRTAAGLGWLSLLVLLAGTFVTTLDFFIVNVAIPSLSADLRAGPTAIQFTVAGYGLALAAGLITGGRLGDLYGRRRLLMVGLAGFTAASLVCGLAPTVGVLIAARVAQGVAAALLMPQVLAILNAEFTGARRSRAFGAYGLAIGLGAVFGQLIGGVLIHLDLAGAGWRSIFLINVPIGLAAVLLAPRLLRESRSPVAARPDLVGTALVTVGLVAVVLPLVEGQDLGWPGWLFGCLAAAVPLLAGFAVHQRRRAAGGRAPLVTPSLFAARSYSVGVVLAFVFQLTMASFFLVLALYLQEGRGLGALGAGLIFVPMGLGYFVATMLSGRVAARLGRYTITLGAAIVAVGYGLLAETATGWSHASVETLIPALVVAGAGMGFAIPPLPAIALSKVAPANVAAGSGVLTAAQQAGGAVGVALVGVVFYRVLGAQPTPDSYPPAFAVALTLLAAVDLLVALGALLLPRRG